MKAQRLRFRYRLTPAGVELRHRDIVDAWVAACAAAGLPVAMTEGKRPAPVLSLGAPLPQGATSDCELVDVYFAERVDPVAALRAVSGLFPPGVEPVAVEEIGINAPSLQADLRWSEYLVVIPLDGRSETDVQTAIHDLLAARTVPAEYKRETKTKRYDLRPLVLDLALEGVSEESVRLRMRLRAEQEATARADQTVLALGLPAPSHTHRTRLVVAEIPAAVAAFRAAGEPRADR